jgi:hypothetical protein
MLRFLPQVVVLILFPTLLDAANPTANQLYNFDGQNLDAYYGSATQGAGDVNGDGFGDLLIGAPYSDQNGTDTGKVEVRSGRDGSILYTYLGQNPGDNLGYAVAAVGDLNHDGFADFALASPFETINNLNHAGVVRIYSGRDGIILNQLGTAMVFKGDKTSATLGKAINSVGDVNHDGTDDLMIGLPGSAAPPTAQYASNLGVVWIISGADGSKLFTLNSTGGFESFGIALDGAGDVNHDGFVDFIVGASGHSEVSGSDTGAAYIYSGANGSLMQTLYGTMGAGNNFGISVSGLGDVNLDGYADVVVGAPGDETSSTPGNVGFAYVFDGKHLPTANQQRCNMSSSCGASGTCCPTIYSFHGDTNSHGGGGAKLGNSVDGPGDINNDGYPDILAGENFSGMAQADPGIVRLYSGKTGAVLFDSTSSLLGDLFGYVVGVAGDINGDCIPDWLGAGQIISVSSAPTGHVEVFSAVAGFAGGCFPNADSSNNQADGSGDDSTAIVPSTVIAPSVEGSATSGCGLVRTTERHSVMPILLIGAIFLWIFRMRRASC